METGFLSLKEHEVRLYRVMNVSLSRSLFQRLFGLGTIHFDSSDRDLKCFDIKNIKKSAQVKEMFSNAVEEERLRNRVSSREYMMNGDDGGGHDDDGDGHDDDGDGYDDGDDLGE